MKNQTRQRYRSPSNSRKQLSEGFLVDRFIASCSDEIFSGGIILEIKDFQKRFKKFKKTYDFS